MSNTSKSNAARFTAGPWHSDEDCDVLCGDGSLVAQCRTGAQWFDEDRANSHLMAASPALFEALEEAVRLMPLGTAIRAEWMSKATAAIAHARGEGGAK